MLTFIASAHDSRYWTAPHPRRVSTSKMRRNQHIKYVPASGAPSKITNDETRINRYSGVGVGGRVGARRRRNSDQKWCQSDMLTVLFCPL